MSESSQRSEMAARRILYPTDGRDALVVHRDLPYGESREGLSFDLYRATGSRDGTTSPVVVLVTGYSDHGMRRMLGCAAKEMGSYVSWCEVLALSGVSAITALVFDPSADVPVLLSHIRRHADELGLDPHRIGVWACSGNVPNALAVVARDVAESKEGNRPHVRCAAFFYGYMLDLYGSTAVAEAAAQFRFVNASHDLSLEALSAKVPLFVARAGQDAMPGLNASVDAFVSAAVARNLPISLVNHPDGPHAFDLVTDDHHTRGVIAQALTFFEAHLAGARRV